MQVTNNIEKESKSEDALTKTLHGFNFSFSYIFALTEASRETIGLGFSTEKKQKATNNLRFGQNNSNVEESEEKKH